MLNIYFKFLLILGFTIQIIAQEFNSVDIIKSNKVKSVTIYEKASWYTFSAGYGEKSYRYEYDELGLLVKKNVYISDISFIYSYDKKGKLITQKFFRDAGNDFRRIDSLFYTTDGKLLYQNSYDNDNNLIENITYDYTDDKMILKNINHKIFDPSYEKIIFSNDNKTKEIIRYTPRNEILDRKIYKYDGGDNLVEEFNYYDDSTRNTINKWTYDEKGKLSFIIEENAFQTSKIIFDYDDKSLINKLYYRFLKNNELISTHYYIYEYYN
ncbi:MAG: hypothetical protein IPH97_17620 [Ignavibacteriales bacterium]|nr:hypothetical protein [Ignavibacteriales bacterium]